MIYLALGFGLLVSPLSAAEQATACAPALDVPVASKQVLTQIARAPDAASAKALTDRMFAEFWTVAPDAQAQALLDEGMARRAGYDFEGAAKALDALIAYCPDYAEGYNQRAFVAFLRGNYGTSVALLERAVEINPEHFAALAGLAVSLIHQGRNAAGQSVLRQALELNPWLPEKGFLTSGLSKEL